MQSQTQRFDRAPRPPASPTRRLPLLLAGALLGLTQGPARAQTGPFLEGELIVRAQASGGGTAIRRIVPWSGTGATLATAQVWGGWSSSLAYDPYRDALLASASFAPDTLFYYRLWAIDGRGTKRPLPGFAKRPLRAITPTGDGRVFLMEQLSSVNAGPIQWLDAQDGVHTLLDASGSAPFVFPLERMLYHAAGNALIGANSGWWASNDCAPTGASFFRIPLSADGTRVGGPIACVSFSNNTPEVMGFDWLPSGEILVTLAVNGGVTEDRLVRLDPWSLSTSGWADPNVSDINGGVYAQSLGQAVILDDWTNQLRLVPQGLGGTNQGSVLPVDVPVGDPSTGFSPAETLNEVQGVLGHCNGYANLYGAGLGGSGGFLPLLTLSGCPDLGKTAILRVAEARGAASGFLGLSFATGNLPLKGGTVWIDPSATLLPFVTSGSPSQPASGAFALPFTNLEPLLIGLSIYAQALVNDNQAPFGWAFSNGLEIRFG